LLHADHRFTFAYSSDVMNTRILVALWFMLAVVRPCYAAGEAAPGQFKASSEVSALVAELQSDNASNRIHAARALVAVGPSSAQALAQAMGHRPSEKTASAMIDAFVRLGSDAVPMMLALIRTEQSWELRHNPGLSGILKMGTSAEDALKELSQVRQQGGAIRELPHK
jgi:hypothetical protein